MQNLSTVHHTGCKAKEQWHISRTVLYNLTYNLITEKRTACLSVAYNSVRTYLYLVIPQNRHHRRGGDHERGERLNSGATEEARTTRVATPIVNRGHQCGQSPPKWPETTTATPQQGRHLRVVNRGQQSGQTPLNWDQRRGKDHRVTTPVATKGHESDQMPLELPEAAQMVRGH